MSEVEYVETLRKAAQDYLSQIRQPDDDMPRAMRRWDDLRAKMSTHTFLRLCDAWLATEKKL